MSSTRTKVGSVLLKGGLGHLPEEANSFEDIGIKNPITLYPKEGDRVMIKDLPGCKTKRGNGKWGNILTLF